MTDLLTKVSYGRVSGRFIVSDGLNNDVDVDADDVKPAQGTITFTPLVEAVQFPTSSPPVTVVQKPIVCRLDAEGYLIDANNKRGVWLVSTDDTDGFPAVWGYKVQTNITDVKTPRIFTISVPTNAEVDLASAAPAAPSVPVPASIILLMNMAIAAAAAVTSLVAEDHGLVDDTLLIEVPGSHELDLTGDLEVTVSTVGDVTLFVHGSGTVTVAGTDFAVEDGAVIVVVTSPRGAQQAYVVGGVASGGGSGDATPPSAVTSLVATGGVGQVALSWSASTDAESTVMYRYRVWLTSGGASGAWASTSGTSVTVTGLAAGSYTAEVYAYSAGGATVSDSDTATVTAPVVEPTWTHTDSFTGADGTSLSGRALAVGGLSWAHPSAASQAGVEDIGIITSNRIENSESGTMLRGAQITLPQANVVAQVTYDLTTGSAAPGERRAYVWVTSVDNADALAVQVRGDGSLYCFKGGVAEQILTGATTGIPQTGFLRVSYNAGTLTVVTPAGTATATVPINSSFSGGGRKAGFGARGNGAKVDDFKAGLL